MILFIMRNARARKPTGAKNVLHISTKRSTVTITHFTPNLTVEGSVYAIKAPQKLPLRTKTEKL